MHGQCTRHLSCTTVTPNLVFVSVPRLLPVCLQLPSTTPIITTYLIAPTPILLRSAPHRIASHQLISHRASSRPAPANWLTPEPRDVCHRLLGHRPSFKRSRGPRCDITRDRWVEKRWLTTCRATARKFIQRAPRVSAVNPYRFHRSAHDSNANPRRSEFSSKDLHTVGNYQIGRLIGKGSFGKVYLASHKLTNGSKVSAYRHNERGDARRSRGQG